MATPATSFQPKTDATASIRSESPRHSILASAPIDRSSSPTQLLMADGVKVQGLLQPAAVFSSETGGKKAPAVTDQRQRDSDKGR